MKYLLLLLPLALAGCGGGGATAIQASSSPPPTVQTTSGSSTSSSSSSSSSGSSASSSSSSSSGSSGSSTSSSSSSSGVTASPPPPNTGYGGIWTSTGTDLLFTSPLDDQAAWSGTFNFYEEVFVPGCGSADVGYAGELTAAGNVLSGTGNQSNWDDCPGILSDSFNGTITPGQSLTLTVVDSTGAQSTITWAFDPLYLNPSSLIAIAGQWTLSDGSTLNIGSNGNASVSNLPSQYTGCSVGGNVAIINPQFNLYSFTLSWNGCPSGPYENGQQLVGYLALDASTTPAQLLGGGVLNTGTGAALNQALLGVAQ